MPPRALVVEDDSKTREALRAIIEAEGFEVDTAGDGEKAIQYLSLHRYSIILLDIVLPKVSGTAVMEFMRTNTPESLRNVIVVTGVEVSEIRKLFPTVYHALGKPVLPARLRSSVRSAVQRSDEANAVA